MARFKFRLEASLSLAEQALESAQRELAEEVRRWQACKLARAAQRENLLTAQEEQRDAARQHPENLELCQIFAHEQQTRLRQCETRLCEQEKVMEKARGRLLTAHQDVEKFRRLKEKQVKAFLLAEAQKEQKILDETGQILYWRQRLI